MILDWTFVEPQRVHLVWLALAIVGGLAVLELRTRDAMAMFLSPVMQRRLTASSSASRTIARLALVLAALLFGVVALMRPQVRGERVEVSTSTAAADVMFVLDTSRSMLAEDASPNRLARAKAEISQLVGRLDNHRVGLIAFAGRAVQVCPLTPDHSFFDTVLGTVDTRSAGKGGSKVGEALRVALRGFPPGQGARLIVLITDGDDQDPYTEDAAKAVRDAGVKIVAVGLGKEAGSEITLTDPTTGAKTVLMDKQGKPVISKLDGKMLGKIAVLTEGAYMPAGTSALDLDSIMESHVKPIVLAAAENLKREIPDEQYPWLVMLAIACLLASLWIGAGAGDARKVRIMKSVIVFVLVATGCLRGEDRPARALYNAGIAALAGSNYVEAEDQLVKARSEAGVDPELRYRAAYDVGLAFAAHADKVKSPANEGGADLKKALDLEQEAVWWFGDALRIREKDPDATANLAIVRARMQAISDELHKDEAKLEVRLEQLIVAQRKVLDGVRAAWREIAKLGGRDPLAQQGNLVALADQSRGIVAEAGTIDDIAADEIAKIGKKPQDKREAQEQARLAQLKNLDGYIGEARSRIAETRRELQQLSADTAVAKAEAALVALKRAREQLDDPITVLQHALQDEIALDGETHQAQAASGSTGAFGAHAETAPVDKWLEYTALAGRQSGIRDRVDEVRLRLQGAADQKPDATKPADPKQEKLLAQVRAALPSVIAATMAMSKAHDTLLDKQWKPARDAESEAALALFAAIEQFADLKHTVDLAYASHQELLGLLQAPDSPELPAAERGKRVADDLKGNLARLDRLTGLVADALADVKDPEPPKPDPKADPKAVEAELARAKAQVEQQRAMFAHAEELRAKAKVELGALEKAIATNGDAVGAAKTADATLDELRRLFFDVIEHLQQLARDQGETRDRTTKLADVDELARQDQLPGLTTRQDEHGQMAKLVADALAKQADELAKQGSGPATGPTVNQPGQPSPAERAKALSGAVAEVRSARNDMSDASAGLGKGKTQSLAVDPIAKSQESAIEHLVKALQLLQPPPKKQDQKQDQDQQKQDQQKQDQQKKADEKKPDQQQGGAGQRARDEDAKRQKAKQDRNNSSDSVDQDW